MIPEKTITKEDLIGMFQDISNETDWDMTEPMLWSYYFANREVEPLEKAQKALEAKEYLTVDISLAEKEEESEEDFYFLHIAKIEVHTPDTLDARNEELYSFAEKFGLDAYDGMEVGPLEDDNEKDEE